MTATVKLNDAETERLASVQRLAARCPHQRPCRKCLNILISTVQGIVANRINADRAWRGAQS